MYLNWLDFLHHNQLACTLLLSIFQSVSTSLPVAYRTEYIQRWIWIPFNRQQQQQRHTRYPKAQPQLVVLRYIGQRPLHQSYTFQPKSLISTTERTCGLYDIYYIFRSVGNGLISSPFTYLLSRLLSVYLSPNLYRTFVASPHISSSIGLLSPLSSSFLIGTSCIRAV
jgi:hypothetical protein